MSKTLIQDRYIFDRTFVVNSGNSILENIYPTLFNSFSKDVIFTGHENNSLFFEIREKVTPLNSNNEKSVISTPLTVQQSETDSTVNILDYQFKIINVDGGKLYFTLLEEPEKYKRDRLSQFFGIRSKIFDKNDSIIFYGKVIDETASTLTGYTDDYKKTVVINKKDIHHIAKAN